MDQRSFRVGRCRAFTLIELLVVIAIIGLLFALLLPAVQAARESARRTQCTNNLKQIALALNNYQTSQSVLPPGYVCLFSHKLELGPGWGWFSMILPEFEQRPVFDSINFDLGIEKGENETARLTVISSLLCPSDKYKERLWAKFWPDKGLPIGTPICQLAGSNYVGMFGVGEPGVFGEGVFYRNSSVRYRESTDGLTQTITVGERSHKLGNATWVGSVTRATLGPPDDWDGSVGRFRIEPGPGMILGHSGEGLGPGDPRGDFNMFYSLHGKGF